MNENLYDNSLSLNDLSKISLNENLIDDPKTGRLIDDSTFVGDASAEKSEEKLADSISNNSNSDANAAKNILNDISKDTTENVNENKPEYKEKVVYDDQGVKITEYTADLGNVNEGTTEYKFSDYTIESYVIQDGAYSGMTRPERLDLNAVDAIEANNDNFIGEPVSDMQNHHEQEMPNSCAIACQEYAIESITGQELDEAELREIGKNYGYTDDGGTPFIFAGKVAEQYGLESEYCSPITGEGLTLENAMERIENGEKLIVGADTSKLYYPDNVFRPFMITQPNHAIEIIGFDKTNPDDIKVIVNDPAFEDGAGNIYSWDEFSSCCDKDFVTIHK